MFAVLKTGGKQYKVQADIALSNIDIYKAFAQTTPQFGIGTSREWLSARLRATADRAMHITPPWLITSTDGQPMKEPPHPILALDKVRYVGDHVAMVVAETLEQAQNAAQVPQQSGQFCRPRAVDFTREFK